MTAAASSAPRDPEHILMQSIYAKYHAEIDRAIDATLVPPAFLAALIANETGGDPAKKRFEKGILEQLWEVVMGRQAHFGSIGREDIYNFALVPGELSGTGDLRLAVPAHINTAFANLDALATSWGLTQIMGYETIALGVPLAALQAPASSLQVTVRMLKLFATGKGIDLSAVGVAGGLAGESASELFDCWNTGRPHAPTADPKYIPNGLARMAIYKALQEEPPKVVSA